MKKNYPDPFNPSTGIDFSVPKDGFVSVKVFDILEGEITNRVNEFLKAGKYSVRFNGDGLSIGVNYYKLNSGITGIQKAMVLMK